MTTKIKSKQFEVSSSRIICSDPCYKEEPGLIIDAINGLWNVMVETTNSKSWGRRIKSFEAHHEKFDYDNEEYHDLGVDSGQFGVFDFASYQNDKLVKPKAKLPEWIDMERSGDQWYGYCCSKTLTKRGYGFVNGGFVSSSGFGDGTYRVTIRTLANKAVGVEVIFIEG